MREDPCIMDAGGLRLEYHFVICVISWSEGFATSHYNAGRRFNPSVGECCRGANDRYVDIVGIQSVHKGRRGMAEQHPLDVVLVVNLQATFGFSDQLG